MDGSQHAFVQAVEVWIPDGNLLQRYQGAYGRHTAFAEASSDLTLEKGQGLPGVAYRSMRPEVWHELGTGFVRSQSARLSGLAAAVALPWFHGNTLVAVVVFLCGSRTDTGGCIEVWEPTEQRLLVHLDGYYGRLSAFEDVSRVMRFPLGQGLPGTVWERGLPCIMEDLSNSTSFMRASAAKESGVQSGLGIPLLCGGQVTHVVTFLSAESTPLARAFEIWMPDATGRLLLKQSHYAAGLGVLKDQSTFMSVGPGEDVAGLVLSSGLPCVLSCTDDSASTRGFMRAKTARDLGLQFAVGLPIHDGDRLRAVVVTFS
jgi:hypothetical protein